MGQIRFGMIGCGVIGNIHAYVMEQLDEVKLVAVADVNEQSTAQMQRKYGCDTYTDYHDMLKRDDIDIVTVCLPTGLHYQAVTDAAKAGKHVIVEKPIDISLERAESMIETCDKYGVKFSVIFQHRFDQVVRLLKNAAEDGTLGSIHFGTSRTIWYRDMEYFKAAGWRGTWTYDGGGALMNQSIHYIDLLQYIMGPVEAVSGLYDKRYHKIIEAEDVGVAILRFKNGSIGTIEGTTLAYPGLNTELNIFGQNGTVCIKNDNLDFYKFKAGEVPEFETLLNFGDQKLMYENYNCIPHKRQYEDVIHSVKNDRQPLVSGREAKKALEIIKAIYRSSECKEWVVL